MSAVNICFEAIRLGSSVAPEASGAAGWPDFSTEPLTPERPLPVLTGAVGG